MWGTIISIKVGKGQPLLYKSLVFLKYVFDLKEIENGQIPTYSVSVSDMFYGEK